MIHSYLTKMGPTSKNYKKWGQLYDENGANFTMKTGSTLRLKWGQLQKWNYDENGVNFTMKMGSTSRLKWGQLHDENGVNFNLKPAWL